jgi:hypothetical protein
MKVVRSMRACSRLASRAGRRWCSRGTGEAKVEEGAADEVDNAGLQVKVGGGVLKVGDEAVTCFEAGDEAAACSRAGIEDGRLRWHDSV